MTDKEYLELLKKFTVTTGDNAEDQRLADEAFDEDYSNWIQDAEEDNEDEERNE